MANRTSNISLILQCNVGVIAGYHLLVRDQDIIRFPKAVSDACRLPEMYRTFLSPPPRQEDMWQLGMIGGHIACFNSL